MTKLLEDVALAIENTIQDNGYICHDCYREEAVIQIAQVAIDVILERLLDSNLIEFAAEDVRQVDSLAKGNPHFKDLAKAAFYAARTFLRKQDDNPAPPTWFLVGDIVKYKEYPYVGVVRQIINNGNSIEVTGWHYKHRPYMTPCQLTLVSRK